MTWVALADPTQRQYSRYGIGIDRQTTPVIADGDHVQMGTGTLLIEVNTPDSDRPELVFGYEFQDQPGHRFLAIRSLPGGGVSCLIGFGSDIHHAALDFPKDGLQKPVWVSLSWNTALAQARLSLDMPGQATIRSKSIPFPSPIFAADMKSATTRAIQLPRAANFIALSNRCEDNGPLPGLTWNTPIDTPFGVKPVGRLQRGDLVVTTDGDTVPILATIQRDLPARGAARPIRVRAPFFGLQRDCIVSASQSIEARGSHVEYAHGSETVLVPAGYLANGHTAQTEPCGPLVTYVQVVTPKHTTLSCSGGGVDSLFLGRLRRQKDVHQYSALSALPRRDMPEHIAHCAPVLDHSATLFLEQQRFG